MSDNFWGTKIYRWLILLCWLNLFPADFADLQASDEGYLSEPGFGGIYWI